MKPVRIGITGGKGFVGRHIQATLSAKKGVFVDSFDYPERDLLDPNPKKLQNFVKNKDVIIHAAASIRTGVYDLISGNVVATYNLLEAVKKTKSKAKVIFISSSAVDAAPSVYGKGKELAELLVEDFARIGKNSAVVLRLTNVFGEGSRPFYNTVVATFCYQVARGEKLKVNKKGPPIMLVYVGDVVKEVSAEALKKRKEKFFFKRVYSKNVITVENLAKLISSFYEPRRPLKLRNSFEKNLYKTYKSFLPQ